jgi:hypothetical protein
MPDRAEPKCDGPENDEGRPPGRPFTTGMDPLPSAHRLVMTRKIYLRQPILNPFVEAQVVRLGKKLSQVLRRL